MLDAVVKSPENNHLIGSGCHGSTMCDFFLSHDHRADMYMLLQETQTSMLHMLQLFIVKYILHLLFVACLTGGVWKLLTYLYKGDLFACGAFAYEST